MFLVLVRLLAKQWRVAVGRGRDVEHRVFRIPADEESFGNYYDETNRMLKCVAGLDPLLEGRNLYHTCM